MLQANTTIRMFTNGAVVGLTNSELQIAEGRLDFNCINFDLIVVLG